jgi:nicotinamidase-related amidase
MQQLKLVIMTAVLLASAISATSQKNNKKALLVIDVQENLLDARSKLHMDPAEVSSFIENLNKSITFFKEHNLPVIYTVNEWSNPFKFINR